MEVAIGTGSTIQASVPKPLFKIEGANRSGRFAVSTDGSRFLINESVQRDERTKPISPKSNWCSIGRRTCGDDFARYRAIALSASQNSGNDTDAASAPSMTDSPSPRSAATAKAIAMR